MNTKDAIRERRAIKFYDPDFVIPQEDEAQLKDLIRQSPTSFNIQNWRIVTVKDKEIRQKIREAAWNQPHVTDASLLFIFCGDVKAYCKNPDRYWEDADPAIQKAIVPKIIEFYDHDLQKQRDEVLRSIGIASQTLMLAAKSMGYDSCPMIGFDAVKVADLINLPEDHEIGMMVVVGKRTKDAFKKGGFLPDDEIFFTDTF